MLGIDSGWMSFGSDLADLPGPGAMRTREGNLIRAILIDAVYQARRLSAGVSYANKCIRERATAEIAELREWATDGSYEIMSLGWVCDVLEQESGHRMDPQAIGEAIVRILDGKMPDLLRGVRHTSENGDNWAQVAA